MKKKVGKIKKLIFSFIIVVGSIAVMVYFVLHDVKVRHFDNYESAMGSNEKMGYAVPFILPKSATDIRLEYGLDPSFVWAEFSYDLRDQQSMTEHFDNIPVPKDAQAAFDRMREVPWARQIPDEKVEIFAINYPAGVLRGHYALLVLEPVGGRAWYFSE